MKQIFIFKQSKEENKIGKFELEKRVIVFNNPNFKKVCMDFYFKNQKGLWRDTLIFAR